MRSQENPDIFRLSQHPYNLLIATIMALLRSSHGVLSEFLLAIHYALTALTMCTLHFHSIHTELRLRVKDAVKSQKNALQSFGVLCDRRCHCVAAGNRTACTSAFCIFLGRCENDVLVRQGFN